MQCCNLEQELDTRCREVRGTKCHLDINGPWNVPWSDAQQQGARNNRGSNGGHVEPTEAGLPYHRYEVLPEHRANALSAHRD